MDTNENLERNSFVLRASAGPYVLYPVVVTLAIFVWLPYVIKTHDWRPIEAISIGALLFFAPVVYMGSRYRICFRDGKITRRTAGIVGAVTTIKLENIKRVEQQTSGLQTILLHRRPYRRITIWGKGKDGSERIDVSLKHFRPADIRKLMKIIHDGRPDLVMPEHWI